MSASIDRVRDLIGEARRVYVDSPVARRELEQCLERLDEPLRVALAGSLKAGKSTLLNAIVGQDIAPTDATECTRVVTWYRRGNAPSVTARYGEGRSMNVPVLRREGRLTFDFGDLTADQVDRLDVEWPTRALQSTTIIDTPGTSSLSREVSERTVDLLTPEDATSGADAVVYLLRTLGASDTAFLGRINESVRGEPAAGSSITAAAGPLGVIGVLSRADEVGAGRMDAMLSAKDVAARFAVELERTGLCQAVVPVAGLLALGARTLKQSEYAAFVALARLAPEDLQLAMLSADRFCRPDAALPVDSRTRSELADRFGLFGIRTAITLIRLGTPDASTLAAELVDRSGLTELRRILDVQFGQRADQLKTHSALVSLDRVLTDEPRAGAYDLHSNVARALADGHGFQELRLLGQLRARPLRLSESDQQALTRIVGGGGIDVLTRLGLSPDDGVAVQRESALAAVRLWRSRAGHPLLDQFTARACAAAARSAEGILAELA